MNNNSYKVVNLYNQQNPWTSVPFQPRPTTTMNIPFSEKACTTDPVQSPQPIFNKESTVASSSSVTSYHEKINEILTNWQQLQKQKKVYDTQRQPQNEFDQIMEEVLEYQLKELELEEEKQSKLIEQVTDEQLEQQAEPKEEDEHDKQYHKRLKTNNIWKHHEQNKDYLFEEFKKYPQNQPLNRGKFDRIRKLFHRKQQPIMEFATVGEQKHDMYLKQIMNKGNQMKMNKIIRLLELCYRTKKSYVQPSK